MTNFEKYKDTIEKLENKYSFTLDLDGNVVNCNDIPCSNCKFQDFASCKNNRINWLFKEYKESVLSDDELELIKAISKISGKKYKYICRNGYSIFLFSEKPPIDRFGVRFTDKCNYLIITDRYGDKSLFLNIKYKDGLYDIKNKCFIKGEGGNKNDKAKSNRCFGRYES